MLFGKKSRKRDLRIFRIPEDTPEGKKLPLRLVIGLIAPFVIVALFLLLFSRKIDLTTAVLKSGIPPVPVATPPPVPVIPFVPAATLVPVGAIRELPPPKPSLSDVKKSEPVATVVTPLAPAIGRFTIQVGSFSSKEDADLLALKLNDHGHAAYVVMANILDKGTWYRVRVGKYQDRSSALDAAERLSRAEQISFIITSEP
ncbi:MAG: SPOR domain-containing protein [Nitrospirae bacterium]|nr:SPOR domain-containing protein [Candidatus Troglogloeales bacterium]